MSYKFRRGESFSLNYYCLANLVRVLGNPNVTMLCIVVALNTFRHILRENIVLEQQQNVFHCVEV